MVIFITISCFASSIFFFEKFLYLRVVKHASEGLFAGQIMQLLQNEEEQREVGPGLHGLR